MIIHFLKAIDDELKVRAETSTFQWTVFDLASEEMTIEKKRKGLYELLSSSVTG